VDRQARLEIPTAVMISKARSIGPVMNGIDDSSSGKLVQQHSGPELLDSSVTLPTQTIDLDSLFTKDLSDSGSFDFRHLRDLSFGKLLEALPTPALLIDSSHAIVFANEASARICHDQSKVLGVPFHSLFPIVSESQRVDSLLNTIFRDRKTQTVEGLMRPNAGTFWCRIHFRSVRLRHHRSVLALVEDLTAEKRQLVLNERYQQLVQVFPIGIAEFSLGDPVPMEAPVNETLAAVARARLLGGNHEFARLSGRPNIDALKGTRFADTFSFSKPCEQEYSSWIAGGFPVRSFETTECGPDDLVRFFENTLVGNVKSGHLLGFWGMKQDITERKIAERALRAARDKLEERVKERTGELVKTNQRLREQILEREKAEQKLAALVVELQDALSKVKTLSGLLPICASCKKIRDDKGYWTQVDVYVREHSDADFTHSICPDCAARLYPGYYDGGP
jgi:PAS domain-containing protein